MRKILVTGALSIDLFADIQDVPSWDGMARSKSVKYVPGGKGLNTAVAAARLGGNVSLIGKLGQDDFGKQILKFLQKEDIDLKGISYSKLPTSIVVFTVSKKGEEALLYAYGSDQELGESDIEKNKDLIERSDIIVANYGVPVKTIDKLFSAAKTLDKTTILNPSIPPVKPNLNFKNTNYLILNESELAFYAGSKEVLKDVDKIVALAGKLRSRGPDFIIVTLGSDGSICVSGTKTIRTKGFTVKAVDTTGAGDSFVGAFAVSLSKSRNLDESLKFANKVASVVVKKVGTVTSIPYLHEIENS